MKKWKFILTSLIATTSIPFISLTSCNKPIVQSYSVHTVNNFEIDWSNIPKAPINIFKWTEQVPQYETYAQMVFVKTQNDESGFVIKLLSNDPNPLKNQDTPGEDDVYKNSCLEAFFKFATEKKYFNIEVDSDNKSCQQFGYPWSEGQGRTKIKDSEWCFVTNAQDEEKYWETKIYMNLSHICYWYNLDQPGTLSVDDFKNGFTFKGNFFTTCATPGPKEHYGMWNNVENKDHTFHDPSCFGNFTIVN